MMCYRKIVRKTKRDKIRAKVLTKKFKMKPILIRVYNRTDNWDEKDIDKNNTKQ